MKFIIYSNPRTGSTYLSLLLKKYLTNRLPNNEVAWRYGFYETNEDEHISVSEFEDRDNIVIHTHQYEVVEKYYSKDTILVTPCRNLYDTALSWTIAQHTSVYHLIAADERRNYYKKFKDNNFNISLDIYETLLRKSQGFYRDIVNLKNFNEFKIVNYSKLFDTKYTLDYLNLPLTDNIYNITPNTIPIPFNKWEKIDLELYNKIQQFISWHKANDQIPALKKIFPELY